MGIKDVNNGERGDRSRVVLDNVRWVLRVKKGRKDE